MAFHLLLNFKVFCFSIYSEMSRHSLGIDLYNLFRKRFSSKESIFQGIFYGPCVAALYGFMSFFLLLGSKLAAHMGLATYFSSLAT